MFYFYFSPGYIKSYIKYMDDETASNYVIGISALIIALTIFAMYFFSKGKRYETEYNNGIEAFQNKKYEQAIGFFIKAIAINSDRPFAHYNLALTHMALNKYDDAEKSFKRTIEINDNDNDAYHNLGLLYYNAGKYKEALTYFKKLTERKNKEIEPLYLLGLCQLNLNEPDEAIECFNRVIALNKSENNATYYYMLGSSYDKRFNSSGDFDDLKTAMEIYNKSIEIDDQNEEVHYTMAVCCAKQGLWEDCMNHCKRVIELNDKAEEAYNQMGLAMYCSGEYETAITMYRKTIELNPNLVDAYQNFGYALEKHGNFQEAVTMFKKYLELNPHTEAKDMIRNHIAELEESIRAKDGGDLIY